MSKDYAIGIYIRLSMADEDTGYGNKAESDSIGNQRISAMYIHDQDNIEIVWKFGDIFDEAEISKVVP